MALMDIAPEACTKM